MSFQITVLKVLAGHPGGLLSVADLKRAVAILISSGPDWTNRTKRLADRAPGLDIFSQAFVLRDVAGWQITEAGRHFLASLEVPTLESAIVEQGPKAESNPALPKVPSAATGVDRRPRRRVRKQRGAA